MKIEWKKTFEVSKTFNTFFILFIFLSFFIIFILNFLDYYHVTSMSLTTFFSVSIVLFSYVSFILLPLMIYFGYQSRSKFNITHIDLFHLQIPLIAIISTVFLFGILISLSGFTYYPNGIHVWYGGSFSLFKSSLYGIATFISVSILGSSIGYFIPIKFSKKKV